MGLQTQMLSSENDKTKHFALSTFFSVASLLNHNLWLFRQAQESNIIPQLGGLCFQPLWWVHVVGKPSINWRRKKRVHFQRQPAGLSQERINSEAPDLVSYCCLLWVKAFLAPFQGQHRRMTHASLPPRSKPSCPDFSSQGDGFLKIQVFNMLASGFGKSCFPGELEACCP